MNPTTTISRKLAPPLRRLARWILLSGLVVAAAACPSPDESADGTEAASDTVTQRQRFEALEDARVPGAGGLTGALDASDAAAARAAQRDSLLRDP